MEGHGGTFLLPALIVIIAFFPLIGIVFNLFSGKISWQNIPKSIQYGLMFSFFYIAFFLAFWNQTSQLHRACLSHCRLIFSLVFG